MPRTPRASTATRDLVRHCHSGLEMDRLPQRLLSSLRRLVPVDAAFFAAADPETLLFTYAVSEDPLDTSRPLFLENEFADGDVNKFAALATSRTHIATLDSATRNERFASPRYRDIMRPLGLGDELRAALVVGSECWGYLCLHRADEPGGFTAAEVSLVAGVAPHLAHALRHAALTRAPVQTAAVNSEPGVVVLDDDLGVVAVTPQAAMLVEEMPDGTPNLPLPVSLYTVAAALQGIERGTAAPATMPITRVRTRDGEWLTVSASRLHRADGARQITVVVSRSDPASTATLRLSAHGLSRREIEIATLVLRGASTRVMSSTLHISEHTVQDHLKAIFDKTGVRSRRELVGLMFS